LGSKIEKENRANVAPKKKEIIMKKTQTESNENVANTPATRKRALPEKKKVGSKSSNPRPKSTEKLTARAEDASAEVKKARLEAERLEKAATKATDEAGKAQERDRKADEAAKAKAAEREKEEKLEMEKMAKAVKFINKKDAQSGKLMIEVGQYIVDEFFGGSAKEALTNNAHKSFSLRKLSKMEGITMSYDRIQRCVRLVDQQQQMGTDASMLDSLSPTHQIALLSVEKVEDKVRIAKLAVEKGMSVSTLKEAIKAEKSQNTDRPSMTPYTVTSKVVCSITLEAVEKAEASKKEQLIQEIQSMYAHLSELVQELNLDTQETSGSPASVIPMSSDSGRPSISAEAHR
jgi:hypothetical protein